MNRRLFLKGGLLGMIVGTITAVKKESVEQPNVMVCEGPHELDESYIKNPAISISSGDLRSSRTLIPCNKCGMLFAIKASTLPPKPPVIEPEISGVLHIEPLDATMDVVTYPDILRWR